MALSIIKVWKTDFPATRVLVLDYEKEDLTKTWKDLGFTVGDSMVKPEDLCRSEEEMDRMMRLFELVP